MKNSLLILALVCTMFCFADVPILPVQEGENYRAGEIVAFVPKTSDNADVVATTLETWGYAATRAEVDFESFSLKLYQAKDRSAAKSVEEAVSVFNSTIRGEAKLLPNYIFRVTNDPLFNRIDVVKDKEGNPINIVLEWDMNNPGELGGVAGADLQVKEAWKLLPANGEPVVVAVIDTGVDVNHPGLKGRVLLKDGKAVGKDFTAWSNAADAFLDDHGHGSHCAGSIAAGYNDGEGMTGSAGPANVKIIAVKALAKDGAGDLFTIADAMEWAGKQNADILSMSLGATPMMPEQEPVLKQLFDEILSAPALKNSIVVAAAGNDGKDIHAFPAFCEKTISIGASDHQDQLAKFSNFGNWVNVASPGVNIVSIRAKFNGKYLDMYQDAGFKKAEFAIGNGAKDPYEQRGYFVASGTSMATPNAAGVVAMMLYANPNLKGKTDAVRNILKTTSDKQGTFKIQSGRINAHKAVEAAMDAK